MVDSPISGWGLPDDDEALLPLNAFPGALEASRRVKSGPGILYGVTVTNTSASAVFFQYFDASTMPADGAFPLASKNVPANDAVGLNWLPGRTFLVGICVCISSTNATKTLGGAVAIFDCQFV